MSPQPPQCGDCDKEIPFDRYQIGLCAECEKERAMSDPNAHRLNKEIDPATLCRCGHYYDNHDSDPPFDAACMEPECDCEGFEEREFEPDYDGPDDSAERESEAAWRMDHSWMKEQG